MNKAVELLKRGGTFYLATTEVDQPKIRPFGVVEEINEKVYICTNNTKECFRQILANPKVEICAMLGAEKWIRITGILKQDSSMETKQEFLKQSFVKTYKADDGIFEILYFEKGIVNIYSFSGEHESFELYS